MKGHFAFEKNALSPGLKGYEIYPKFYPMDGKSYPYPAVPIPVIKFVPVPTGTRRYTRGYGYTRNPHSFTRHTGQKNRPIMGIIHEVATVILEYSRNRF